jgi:phosphotransferase system HPr (HPr) family protein
MTLTRTVKLTNPLGLHARAAAKIAKLAENARCAVFIAKDGEEADAASILDVIGLYCPCGSEITVRITDPKDIDILNGIVQMIGAGFGEM